MYRSLLRYAVYHPRTVAAIALLLSAVALVFIPGIKLKLDGRSLIPAHEPGLAGSDSAAALFELKDIVVVSLVARDGGVITEEGLKRIGRISSELQESPGIAEGTVTSLTTLPLLDGRNGTIDPDAPIGTAPVDRARVERVRGQIAALGLDNGVLLSPEGNAAAIYAFAKGDADREELLERVITIADANSGENFEIALGGNALAQAELGRSVAIDLFYLIPFLLVVLMALITFVFRSGRAAMVSLMEIGLSLVWTIGLIGILGQPVFITTLALPVVLIAIGVTDDIYAINRYMGRRRKSPNVPNEEVVIEAFHSVHRPIMLTALTSMCGLGSLAFTSLEPLRIFGIFGAVAIGLSTLLTFTMVPAMLVLAPPAMRPSGVRSNRRLAKVAIGLLSAIERAGIRKVVAAAVLLAAGAVVVATHLRIDDSWVQNLSPSSRVALGDKVINTHLAGSTTVEFAVTTGEKGFTDPAAFRRLAALEDSLAHVPRVGAVQSSYSDLLRIIATLRGVGYEEFRAGLRSGSETVDQGDIEAALMIDETLDRPHMGRYLSEDRTSARVTAFVHGADYERLRPVFETAERESGGNAGGNSPITPFGDGWISYLTVKLLVEGQIFSIAFAALADLLLVALMLRSFRTACVAVIPVAIAVIFTFATLVLIGSPLGIASSMFASIALGIGVDYSIHLSSEIRRACRRSPNLRAALRRALSETAASIIISACTITSGFAVLLFSAVVPNRMLGLLVCISLGFCALMTLTIVPGLAEIFGVWRAARDTERKDDVVLPTKNISAFSRLNAEVEG